MAHKKGAGSSRNGRDSESKRLGVKAFWTVRTPKQATLLSAREVPNIIPALM